MEYSLVQRTTERDLLPMARAFDLAVTPWAVVGGGILTGKYAKKGDALEADDSKRVEIMNPQRASDRNLAVAREVQAIAGERGVTCAQVAINWVRQQPGLIIPILGARTVSQLEENLACLEFTLSEEDLQRLDETSRVDLGFPHDFLSSEKIRDVCFGETFPWIDNHRRT